MKFTIFTSTIFLKIVMAITGIILVGFIFGHAMGNLQLFLGKDVFNSYAHFLQKGLGEFLWLIRITLIVSALLHILISVRLKLLNLSAKPNAYAVKSYLKSTLYSRTMIYTGILVGLFLIFHLLHFTVGNIMPDAYNQYENYGIMNLEVRHDAYSMVIGGFSNMWVSITYILAVVFIGFRGKLKIIIIGFVNSNACKKS